MTTFNTGNYVRITGRQSGRNDLLKTNLTGFPYSLLLPLFHFQIFSRSLPSRHTPLSERLELAMFPRRKANDHVSVTFLSSHFRSSLFPFFSFFLTHVQDRMINVSEILPLRPIKVNNGKFYLLLRSGYFVNGCVFTRVYVICKICEKLRRIHSCRYLLDLSQSVLQ